MSPGPIIRVNHRELHIRDPTYYSTIYAGQGHRINKDPQAVAAFTVPTATLATVDHDTHRLRRSIIAPFFSRRSVNSTEPIINERIDRLIYHLRLAHSSHVIVDLDSAYAALTADIIMTYFYGKHSSNLDRPLFKFPLREAILGLIGFYHVTRFLPSLAAALKSLPIPLVRLIQPGAADLLIHEKELAAKLSSARHGPRSGLSSNAKFSASAVVEALNDAKIPAGERTIRRLVDEGTTVIFAGTETTARALSVMTFHIFNDTRILRRLRAELAPVFTAFEEQGSVPPSTALEVLPFLAGCVNEGLRLSHGPVIRLPRCAMDVPLSYTHGQGKDSQTYTIPSGTPVSQSTLFVHLDESIFPTPKSFDPDRWIKDGKRDFTLERFICSFTKGTRQCLGINMAYAEMFLTISRVVRTFQLDMKGLTRREDLEVRHIRLTGFPAEGNGEVRVRVAEIL